jgi:hypothetical protein
MLILLIGLANWLEVPWVVRFLEAFLAKLSGSMAGKKETE